MLSCSSIALSQALKVLAWLTQLIPTKMLHLYFSPTVELACDYSLILLQVPMILQHLADFTLG